MKEIINYYENYFKENSLENIKKYTKIILNEYYLISNKYNNKFDFEVLNEFNTDLFEKSILSLKGGYNSKSNTIFIEKYSEKEIAKIILFLLAPLQELYRIKNIENTVFFNTISDIIYRISMFYEKNGYVGLQKFEGAWLIRIFYLNMFKLNSLEFELLEFRKNNYDFEFKEDLINENETIISIHIMDDEDISTESSIKSIEMANSFFDIDFRYYICYSWLLYDGMERCLGKNSKILQFRKLFKIIGNSDNSKLAIERIFKNENLEEFIPKTSLQKNILNTKNSMGIGFGIIKR